MAGEVDVEAGEAAADAEEVGEGPRVPEEAFLLQPEPRVQLVLLQVLVLLQALGRAQAAAKRLLPGQQAPRLARKAEPGQVAPRRVKLPELGSARRPAEERRTAAAASRPTSGQLSSFLDVPGPGGGAARWSGTRRRSGRFPARRGGTSRGGSRRRCRCRPRAARRWSARNCWAEFGPESPRSN